MKKLTTLIFLLISINLFSQSLITAGGKPINCGGKYAFTEAPTTNSNNTYMYYDGVDERTALNSTIELNSSSWIFSFWMKQLTTANYAIMFGEEEVGEYFMYFDNLRSRLYVRDTVNKFNYTNYNMPATWTNYVFIKNGIKIDLYINNVFRETLIRVEWVTYFKLKYFASFGNGGLPDNMALDELATYSTAPALYTGTVPDIVTYLYGGGTPETRGYPPDAPTYGANLEHYYDFETGTGTVIYDRVGAINGNNTNMDNTNWRSY